MSIYDLTKGKKIDLNVNSITVDTINTQSITVDNITSHPGNNLQLDPDGIGLLILSNLPTCRVTKSANQSLNDMTPTVISWNQEAFDVGNFHNNAVNNDRLTVPVGLGGLYFVSFQLQFASSGGGTTERYVEVHKNGVAIFKTLIQNATNDVYLNSATLITLAAADYLQIVGFQNSGGALNVVSSYSWFNIAKIGS